MPGPHPKGLKNSLALAVAAGRRVADWAKENGVAPRTAYAWTRRPGFDAKVARLQRRVLERAVGALAAASARNARQINALAASAESEAVRLAAARAAIADLAALRKHLYLEERLSELERRVNDAHGNPPGPA